MQTPSYDLTGRVAVVTGAARGIGRATADLLRERGARLVVSDHSDAVRDLESDHVAALVGDVTDEADRPRHDRARRRAGVIDRDIMEGVVDNGREMLASFGDAHPIARIGGPEEVPEVIAFLASDASSFITGALVAVDGAWTAQ